MVQVSSTSPSHDHAEEQGMDANRNHDSSCPPKQWMYQPMSRDEPSRIDGQHELDRSHNEAGIPPSVNDGLANMRGAVDEAKYDYEESETEVDKCQSTEHSEGDPDEDDVDPENLDICQCLGSLGVLVHVGVYVLLEPTRPEMLLSLVE